tara:strand:- start:408 stop:509 length:102 start_codon:yes stop_codon:yes gene_type:complete
VVVIHGQLLQDYHRLVVVLVLVLMVVGRLLVLE